MRDERFWVVVMGIFVLGVFVFALVNVGLHFTGFAVFSDSGSGFDDGVYNNTFYNGSGVVLFGGNLSGSYISEIFDAGADATWNNLSWISEFDYYQQELPNDGVAESGIGGIDMNKNVLLLHMNDNWSDGSGEGNDGVAYNGATFTTGKLGEGGSFDGSNDYVGCGNDDSLNVRSAITIEAWIKPDTLSTVNQNSILSKSLGYWFFVSNAKKLTFSRFNINDPNMGYGKFSILSTDVNIPTGTWSHVAVSYDTTTGNTVKLYINGEFSKSVNFTNGLIDSTITSLEIGRWQTSHYFDGTIDELSVWNRSLSAMEIANIYKRGALKLNLTTRSCDDNLCSGESWSVVNNPLDLGVSDNRYFQYKVEFVSSGSVSPVLESVDVGYELLDSALPQISFSSQTTENGEYNQDWINVGVDVSDDSQIYSFINLNNSLVGFWKMNESSGNIIDYSGYGNDGVNIGVDYRVAGKFGKALGFDGVSDYINFSSGIPQINESTTVTVAAWIKPENKTTLKDIIVMRNAGENLGKRFFLQSYSTGVFYAQTTGGGSSVISTTDIVLGEWYHVVAVLNGQNLKIYVNGNLDGENVNLTPVTNITVDILTIGAGEGYAASRVFDGDIDEVIIFNRVLSTDEVSALYNAGSYSRNFTNLDYGVYDFYSYVKDVYDNEAQTSARTVTLTDNVPPTVNVFSPVGGSLYDYNESLVLNFVALDSDDNLDSCWYNIDGVVNVSLVGCANGTFSVGGSGGYVLTVYANDSDGLESNDSVSFIVDVEGVDVNISEPIGEKSSRSGIGIVYSVDGVGVSCWYNVKTSIGGSVIGNTSLVNCSGSNFGVSADGDYILNLFVNNSYGSFASDSSNFSVDTSGGTIVVNSPSGGGSGGGGGYFVDSVVMRLEIEAINVIVSLGEEKSLLVGVKNIGSTSVNKCSLVGGDFVVSKDVFNIGAGEIVDFSFVLRALAGVEDLEMRVKCLDNVSQIIPLSIEVLNPSLSVSILGISFSSNDELKVDYSVEPTGDSVSVLYFRILDSEGNVVNEVSEEIELVLGEVYEGSVVMDVGNTGGGMLRIAISDGDVSFVEEDFVYSGSRGFTGFVSLILGSDFSYIGIILIVFLVLAGLLVRRIWKLKKKH